MSIEKVIKVIESCKTDEQLEIAEMWAYRWHRKQPALLTDCPFIIADPRFERYLNAISHAAYLARKRIHSIEDIPT